MERGRHSEGESHLQVLEWAEALCNTEASGALGVDVLCPSVVEGTAQAVLDTPHLLSPGVHRGPH